MNFARLGFALDGGRVSRRASCLLAAHLDQATVGARGEMLALAGFDLSRHFEEAALFEEIRLQSLRKARSMKKAARKKGQVLSSRLVLACTPEGHHMQRLVDQLDSRIREREASLLCG